MDGIREILQDKLERLTEEGSVDLAHWRNNNSRSALVKKKSKDSSDGWLLISAKDSKGLESALAEATLLEPDSIFEII